MSMRKYPWITQDSEKVFNDRNASKGILPYIYIIWHSLFSYYKYLNNVYLVLGTFLIMSQTSVPDSSPPVSETSTTVAIGLRSKQLVYVHKKFNIHFNHQ